MVTHRKEKDDRNHLGKEPVADIVEKGSVTIYDQYARDPITGSFGICEQQERNPQGQYQRSLHLDTSGKGLFGSVDVDRDLYRLFHDCCLKILSKKVQPIWIRNSPEVATLLHLPGPYT